MNSKRSESFTRGSERRKDLASSFIPGDFDVICGKGRGCFNHKGNKTFRKTVDSWLERYSAAETKLEKSAIVSAIVQTVRTQSPEGGFVKKDADTNMWYEVGDHLAREKVGQTIRDALHSQYRSSTKSKKKRRQAEQAVANESMTQMSNNHLQISSKIDQLTTKITSTTSDDQVTDMLTQANLEILNELNRLTNVIPGAGSNLIVDVNFTTTLQPTSMRPEINPLNILNAAAESSFATCTDAVSDCQLTDMLTRANLNILNELNRSRNLNQSAESQHLPPITRVVSI